MQLDSIQQALRSSGIDAWLFYDFHRRDAIAYRVLGLRTHGMATRRWYYLVPAQGEPIKLVHRIESGQLDSLPGERRLYASWQEHSRLLEEMLRTCRTVAMQYSPLNQIPYISAVDAEPLSWSVVLATRWLARHRWCCSLNRAGRPPHSPPTSRLASLSTGSSRRPFKK